LVLLFIACIIAVLCALALTTIAYEKYRHHNTPTAQMDSQLSITNRDMKYALHTIGEKSVYRFFLGKNIWGWLIVIATIAAQIWILSLFVGGSKRDPSDKEVDMVYTWQCTRDNDVCFDKRSIDWKGWLAVLILMLAHLLPDTINGLKMIKHSVKRRHGRNAQIRLFIGGTLLTCISLFTFYVSTIYNSAIASSKLFEHYIIIQLAPFDFF
jgi:hypothetical protein